MLDQQERALQQVMDEIANKETSVDGQIGEIWQEHTVLVTEFQQIMDEIDRVINMDT